MNLSEGRYDEKANSEEVFSSFKDMLSKNKEHDKWKNVKKPRKRKTSSVSTKTVSQAKSKKLSPSSYVTKKNNAMSISWTIFIEIFLFLSAIAFYKLALLLKLISVD